MNKPQTYAEQLARKDIEALDDNDKKLKKLLGEYHDEEITNLKNMTKQTFDNLLKMILRIKNDIKEKDLEAFIKKVYEAGYKEGRFDGSTIAL